jgi:L,D-transpeptidase catalytic domain/Putative peptidoglycan binding domain
MRLLLAALAVLLLMPAAAQAQDPLPTPTPTPTPAPEPVIPLGAKAAGLDIGGLPLSEAAARLGLAFSQPMAQPFEVRVAGHMAKLRLPSIGFVFDPYRTARRANIAARATPPAPDGTYPVDVPLHITYDGDKLDAFLAKLDKRSRIQPRSARLKMTVRRMILRRARMGWSIDEQAVKEQLDTLLADPYAVRVVRLERVRVHPKVNAIDLRRQHRTVLTVDRSSFKLRLFRNLKLRKTYGVAVGAPGYETPTGRFSIRNKAVNPAWSAPDEPWAGAYRNEVVEGGSAENPLKARWMGIVGGVGIHGTAAEYSIGTAASHGCIRMRVADVIDLYDQVPVGAAVLIR